MEKLQLQGLRERLKIDTSEGRPVYLLSVGKTPTYLRLSQTSYYLLEQRSLGVSFESLSQALSQGYKSVSPQEVERAYNQILDRITTIERNPKSKHSEFLIPFTLLPQAWVGTLASYLGVAFYKPVTYFLLATIGLSIALGIHHNLSLELTPTGFFWGYLLFLGSLLMHELGHASACKRYGAEPSDIGFTIYLIWPAFYSDVSAAWRLKRWQRVIVDIGGVFFQLVVAAIYIFLYLLTDWHPLKLALLMIFGSCLFTLNPVLKFDGYWVIADGLGITNLSEQPFRLFKYSIAKIRGQKVKKLPWSPLMLSILAIYSCLSLAILGYLLVTILPLFWREFFNYPSLVLKIWPQLWHWPLLISLEQLNSFAGSTFMVVIGFLMIGHLWQLFFQLARSRKIKKTK